MSTPAALQGQVALVTGASRGIGQAIALELARQGAFVVGTATSEAGASGITATLEQAGLTGRGVVLNVTDAGQADAVIDEMQKSCESPSILVNNAGITRDNLAMLSLIHISEPTRPY